MSELWIKGGYRVERYAIEFTFVEICMVVR